MGRTYEYGSVEEALAISALQRKNKVKLITTLGLINAIILAGDRVISAVSGAGNLPGTEHLHKIIDELKESLVPEFVESRQNSEKIMQQKLKEIEDMGPIRIKMDQRQRSRRR